MMNVCVVTAAAAAYSSTAAHIVPGTYKLHPTTSMSSDE